MSASNNQNAPQIRRLTHADLTKMCAEKNEKIAMLTCYDAAFAALSDEANVDVLLVGDSLGMVLQGHDSPLPVSISDIAYHVKAVKRGAKRALVLADMPFGSFQISPEQAFQNAVILMQAGAQMVKIEGGQLMAKTTQFLVERGIPVCAHVGLTPQSVHQLGGFRVQGKEESSAIRLLEDAKAHENAGAALIVLEAIPSKLAKEATNALSIPTIGIGAGKNCDGQVLVLHDMLDIPPTPKAKFVKNFMAGQTSILEAVKAYVSAVKSGEFPALEHCYS